jgi:hypothetical protein
MPTALELDVKDKVKKLWLSGETRKNVATECGIGAGSVTNVINEWKMDLESSDYEAIRELAVELKKEGLTFVELASMYRRKNYIKKLDASEEQIESFISNISNSQDPQKLIDTANQIAQLSIPLNKIEDHIKRQKEEKEKLKKEVEKARNNLKQTNIGVQTVKEYKRLEVELHKIGLSMSEPDTLVSILKKFKKMRFDPRKIVTEISCVKSLQQREKQLKNSCKVLESRASKYKEIIPLCEQLLPLGIGFAELCAVHAAIVKMVDTEKLSYSRAAFALMDGIDTANKLFNAKKQLNDIWMQIQMLNLFLARQHKALTALIKLQSFGVTDEEILNIHEFLNGVRLESARRIGTHNHFDSYPFNSYELRATNNGSKIGALK